MLIDTWNVEKSEEYNVVPINFLFTNVLMGHPLKKTH